MRALLIALSGMFFLLAVAALAVSRFTSHKLEMGQMVRAEIPGATFVDAEIVAIRPHPGGHTQSGEKFPDQCELTMRVSIDGAERSHRDWADEEDCGRYRVGGTAVVARLPGESELYLKNGTWSSPGNGRFDAGLLVGERSIAAALGLASVGLAIAAALRRPARA